MDHVFDLEAGNPIGAWRDNVRSRPAFRRSDRRRGLRSCKLSCATFFHRIEWRDSSKTVSGTARTTARYRDGGNRWRVAFAQVKLSVRTLSRFVPFACNAGGGNRQNARAAHAAAASLARQLESITLISQPTRCEPGLPNKKVRDVSKRIGRTRRHSIDSAQAACVVRRSTRLASQPIRTSTDFFVCTRQCARHGNAAISKTFSRRATRLGTA